MLTGSSFLGDILEPIPGRAAKTLETTLACMIVVVLSMTYAIPSPAISAYLVFFVAKEDAGSSILTCVVLFLTVTVAVAILILLASTTVNYTQLGILIVAGISFSAFFLAATSKLAPLAGSMGVVVGYGLDVLQSEATSGEVAVRALLYVWLFAGMPIAAFLVYNIYFGRRPDHLLRQALATRLRTCAAALDGDHRAINDVRRSMQAGNGELLAHLKMAGLFRFVSPAIVRRLGGLVTQSYALMMTVAAQPESHSGCPQDRIISDRLAALALRIEKPSAPLAESAEKAPLEGPTSPLSDQLALLVTDIGSLVDKRDQAPPLPVEPAAQAKPKSGFFKPDAFTNPGFFRFAAKSTSAVMICYLGFNILDWPGIHTCMITCFVVCLTTVGESTQKMFLRITGCVIGAALGYVAMVVVLPDVTSIGALIVVLGVMTLPAAWIARGRPSVSYIGFQIALALFLCVLQGVEPKFDLTIARDRFFGILFGNVTVYLIFTTVYPVSLLPRVTNDLIGVIANCRKVLAALVERRPLGMLADQIAALQLSVAQIEGALAAYGFEKRRTRFAQLHLTACKLAASALRRLVDELVAVSSYPSDRDQAPGLFDNVYHDLALQLSGLEDALHEHSPAIIDPALRQTLRLVLSTMRRDAAAPPDRIASLEALDDRMNGLAVVLARYRRILDRSVGAAA